MRVAALVSLVVVVGWGNEALALKVGQCEQRPNRPAPSSLEQSYARKLNVLRQCKSAADDATGCNVFLGRALEILFQNTDFKRGKDSYLLANDIVNALSQPGNGGWKVVGDASDQAALDRAQKLANDGRPIVAARLGATVPGKARKAGHVVLIMPGTAEAINFDGQSWRGLRAPNSASFFLNDVGRIYVGCPLSASWQKPDAVKLYSK